MIFPAGNGRGVSWLDNITAQDNKEVIGKEAIELKELKRLAQVIEEDVNVEDAVEAPVDASPVPEEETVPVSEETVGEEVEEVAADPLTALNTIKDLLDKGSVDEAKAAVEDAISALAVEDDEEVGIEVPVADEAEIPVNLDAATGELKIDEAPGEVVSVEIEDESGEDEGPEHEAKESPEFEAGEKEEEKEFKEKEEKEEKEDDDEEKKSDKFGSSSKFYKIAFLSPENKKKLAEYWKKSLGYDPAYVDMMTKDYEK